MFLNVATFSVTNKSITSTQKEDRFFKTFSPDIAKLFREFWGTRYIMYSKKKKQIVVDGDSC
jgi:hypothetical protein